MSQVIRKYASGGATEKPKLFSVSGLGDFDQKTLIEQGYRNIDEYIASKGLKGDMASNFKNAVQHMLEGIGNGTFSMDAMGNYKDKTGQASSTGEIDRKKFLGIKTGIKNTDNNAYGIAADYIHKLILDSPKYNHPETKSKKFDANEFLAKEISKRWYGGNNIDFNNWFKNRAESDRNALMGEIFSTADYNKLYQDYDWTDTGVNSAEDLANRFKGFSSAIINNKLDNDDYNRFAELGGSGLDKFMKETQESQETTPEQNKMRVWEEEAKAAGASTPEAISAYVQGKQREEADRNAAFVKKNEQEVYNRERDKYFEDFISQNPFKGTTSGYVTNNTSYNPEKVNEYISSAYGNNYGGFVRYMQTALNPKYFKGELKKIINGKDLTDQHLSNNLDIALNAGYLDDLGNGIYGIPSTYDYNNWSFISYNPTTKQYKETSMLANDTYKKLLAHPKYDKNHPTKKENGGIIKFEDGGDTKELAYLKYKQQFEKKREEASKQKAQSKGRTVEEQKIADRKPGSITSGDWTNEDKIILGSIVGDIASMGAAYIPVYGTIASAGLGIGSSLANYGAELSRNGFKWGDLGNLAVNLGLDTVGLVPGLGTAAKGSKILKTAAKYLPRVLATASLYNTPEVINSVKKAMTPGTDLTVDDWRNIAEGFKMVLQGGKGIKRTWQAHNLKKDLATGNKVLTTLGGKEVTLTPAELSEIRSHRKVEDQQAALQLLKKDDNLQLVGDLNKRWFNPTGWLPNSNVRNEYDFNKTKKVKTSNGIIEVPVVYSNSDKYIAAAMQQNFVKIPGFDEIVTKYNDWKYGVKKEKPTKKEPKKESKKESVSGATQSYKPEKPVDTSLKDRIDRNLGINNSPLTATTTKNKREPSHKKSNKKKKTSKDNNVKRREFGGLIFKDGGLIPKYLGGNVMQRGTRGTWLNNDNTFKDATNLGTWDTYYNINGIIDDITKSGVLSNSNADNWVSTANRLSSMDLPWKKQLNAKGYNDWNALYSSTGLNKYFGEDKDKFDYLGPSTWNRRLLLQTLGYKYNSPDNPLTVGTDKVWYDNGVWKKLPSMPKSTTPTQVASQQSEVAPILEEVFSTGKPASTPDKTTRNVKTLPEDVLALGRMVSGLVTNNRAAKIYKEGLKPTLLDTFENYVPLQGNFQAKTSAERQAGNMESVAARPRTSDASLQLAGELEASDKANQARFQGDLQDAEMYYKTRMLGQQESDAAKARRVEVANKNRASMNAIDAAKKQIDAGRVTANYQQVLAPWLAGIENQFRQNRATERQLALESYMSKSNLAYINELNALAEKYKDNSAEFSRQKLLLDNKYSQQISNEKKRLIGSPWLIQFGEKGTKLTYRERAMLQRAKDFNKRLSDDNKQFHRDIMESKREHNKLIMNMSALTAALIKKGMQL